MVNSQWYGQLSMGLIGKILDKFEEPTGNAH